MTAIAWICVTVMVTSAIVSEALPFVPDTEKQSLISMLLQSPPIAEAACLVRDVKSVGVIVNKICDCGGSTVACDIGPIKVGDVEVTFCNKMPNQTVDDLLVMKFACDVSHPTCGEGTPCDIGPIEYNNKKYFLCLYETDFLPPPSDFDICHPALNRPDEPEGVEPQPGSKSERPTTASETADKPTLSPDKAITNPAVTRPAITNPAVTRPAITNPAVTRPAITNPAVTRPAITNPAVTRPAITNPAVTRPAITNPAVTRPAWRPWKPPCYPWQSRSRAVNRRRSPSYRRSPRMGWRIRPWWKMAHMFGGPLGFEDGSQWQHGSSQPGASQPRLHVYERRRWRVGNRGGEITWGRRPQY